MIRLIYLGILLLIISGAWFFLKENSSQPVIEDPFKVYVMEESCRQIAQSLPDPLVPGLLCLLPLSGDSYSLITQQLIREIENSGKYKCISLSDIQSALEEKKINLRNQEDLENLAKDFQADLLASGKVVRFSKSEELSELMIKISVWSLNRKDFILPEKIFSGSLKKEFSLPYYRAWMASQPTTGKLLLWLLLTGLGPLLLSTPLSKALDQESNQVNFLLLLGTCSASFFLALALVGFQISDFLTGFIVTIALLWAILSHYVVLSWLEYIRK